MKKRKKAVRLPYLVLVPFAASVCLVIWMIFSGALMSTDEATQSLGGIFDGTSAVHWPLIPNSPTLQPLIEVLLDTPEFFVMFWNTCILTFPQLIGQFLFASPAACPPWVCIREPPVVSVKGNTFPLHRSSRYPTMYTRFLDWGTPKSLLLRHCHSTPYPSRSSVLRIVANVLQWS